MGIIDWQVKMPQIFFGPQDNCTTIPILPHGQLRPYTTKGKGKDKLDSLVINTSFIQVNLHMDIGLIKCTCPSLNGYEDNGYFAQWFVENPYEKEEKTILFIKVAKV